MPTPAESGVPEMQRVSLATEDGLSLRSWYAPPKDEGSPVVVYFCGNAGHLGYRGFKARRLLDAGFGVLLVGYRGYGGNPGHPTEAGLYADGRAALAFLAGQGIAARRTVLYGESLGTGVAVRVAFEQAQRTPVAAVVLETPYSSITDVAARHYPYVPVRWLLKDRFEAAAHIDAIRAPLLVFHAEDDRVIPIGLARRLFAAAAEPKTAHWFDLGGHEGLFDVGAGALVVDFVRRVAQPPADEPAVRRAPGIPNPPN